MKTTRPPSTSPFEQPRPPQPSASPFPPGSPTSRPATGSGSNFYVDIEPGGKPNQSPDADSRPIRGGTPHSLGPPSPGGSPRSSERTAQSPPPLPGPFAPPAAAVEAGIPGRSLGLLVGRESLPRSRYFGVLPAWSVQSAATTPLLAIAARATLRIMVYRAREHGEQRHRRRRLRDHAGPRTRSATSSRGDAGQEGRHRLQVRLVGDRQEHRRAGDQGEAGGARIETTQQEMEIQRNKGESDIIAARVELALATLDLEKYQKGDYPAETTKQKGEIGLKKKDLQGSKNKLEQYQGLMKKGFKTPNRSVSRRWKSPGIELQYESSILELKVKENFEYRRKTTEYTAKVNQAPTRSNRLGPRPRRRCPRRRANTSRPRRPPTSSSSSSRSTEAEGQDRAPRRAGRGSSPTPTTPGTTPAGRSARAPRSTRSRRSSRCQT